MDSILLQQLENRVTEINTALTIITRWIKTENDRRQDNQSVLEQLVNRVTEFENSLISWIKTQTDNPEIQNLRESNYSDDDANKRQARSQKKVTSKFPRSKFQPKSKLTLRPVVVISKEDYEACEGFCQLNKSEYVESTPQTLFPLAPERSELCSREVLDQIHNEADIPISETIEPCLPTNVNIVNRESEANADLNMSLEAEFEEPHFADDVVEVQVIKLDPGQFETDTTDFTSTADNFDELELENSTLEAGIFDNDEVPTQSSTSKHQQQVPTTKEKESKAVTQKYATTNKKKKPLAVVGAINPHNCEICKKTYSSWLLLQLHTKKLHNIYIYTCATCKQKFNTKTQLITHRQLIHKQLQHNCPICTKPFTYKDLLYDHIIGVHQDQPEKYGIIVQKKTPIGPQKCNNCDKIFESWKKLYAHASNVKCERRKPGEDNNKSLICEICGTTYKSIASLRAHKNSSIHNIEKKLVCTECRQTFTSKYTLQKHMKLHNRIFDVNKKTPKNRTAKRWSRFFDNNGPFICELCGKSSRDWRMYLRHRRTAHNPVIKDIQISTCEICFKEFKTSRNLNRHKKTVHVGSKGYVCGKCGKVYTRSDKLRNHDKKIHGNTTVNVLRV